MPAKAQSDFIELNGGYKGSLYTYRDYLNDHYLSSRIFFEFQKDNYDTLAVLLPRYKNRLGYNYYMMMAGFLQMEHDPYAFNYLDSAFQRGAAPICIQRNIPGFKEEELQQRFLRNTMRAYNAVIIARTDSLLEQDQLYRKEIRKLAGYEAVYKTNYVVDMPPKNWLEKLDVTKRRQIDSLLSLQKEIDYSNQRLLADMASAGKFPRAKKVGLNYCYRNAPDPFQIYAHYFSYSDVAIAGVPFVKNDMRMCTYQLEDWGRIENYLQAIYYRDFEGFREFYFLKINKGEIDKFESALALNQMVVVMVLRKNAKLELSCSDSAVFEQLKNLLLHFSKYIADETEENSRGDNQTELREKIKRENIVFVPNSSLPPDKVEFRLVELSEGKGK